MSMAGFEVTSTPVIQGRASTLWAVSLPNSLWSGLEATLCSFTIESSPSSFSVRVWSPIQMPSGSRSPGATT